MAKITPKRTKLTQKLAYILKPFVLYMLVKTVVMLILALAVPALPITGIAEFVERNSSRISAVINGVASVVAAGFLLNDFLIEVNVSGEVDIDRKIFGQFAAFLKDGFLGKRSAGKTVSLILSAVLGVTASFAFNILIELAAISSEEYEAVEELQYSVPLWLGLVLYGLISPVVEEMVFRGVIYNRVRKFYGIGKAAIFSALLFGLFHGNLPQFLYGTVMGMLMAVCYVYAGCFAAPVLMHMSANIFIFLMSELNARTEFFVTPVWCAVFTAVSAAAVFGIWKCYDRDVKKE